MQITIILFVMSIALSSGALMVMYNDPGQNYRLVVANVTSTGSYETFMLLSKSDSDFQGVYHPLQKTVYYSLWNMIYSAYLPSKSVLMPQSPSNTFDRIVEMVLVPETNIIYMTISYGDDVGCMMSYESWYYNLTSETAEQFATYSQDKYNKSIMAWGTMMDAKENIFYQAWVYASDWNHPILSVIPVNNESLATTVQTTPCTLGSTTYFLTNLNFDPLTGTIVGLLTSPPPAFDVALARIDVTQGTCKVVPISGGSSLGEVTVAAYDAETGLFYFIGTNFSSYYLATVDTNTATLVNQVPVTFQVSAIFVV